MIIQANKEGFTIWSDAGFILTDCPFERLKEDPKLMFDLLTNLHRKMVEHKPNIKEI